MRKTSRRFRIFPLANQITQMPVRVAKIYRYLIGREKCILTLIGWNSKIHFLTLLIGRDKCILTLIG